VRILPQKWPFTVRIDSQGYFDENDNLKPELIQKWPQDIARMFKEGGLKSTQLRRFFNRLRVIEQKLKSGQDFNRLKEEIEVLKPLAAASVGRGNAPESFNRFVEHNVGLVVKSPNPDAFTRGFLVHFQSIIAYTKYLEETEKRGGR